MPNYEMYRMDIVVDVTDEQAEVKLKNLDRTIQSTQKHAGNLGKTDATPHVDKRARTELSNTEKVLGSAKKRADVLHRTRVNPTVSIQDRITSSLKRAESNIGKLTRSSHKVILGGVDRVMPKIREISSGLRGLASKTWTVTIQAKDNVTNVVSSLVNKLTSPLTL
ncbi:MAG TPA: hypothetical protein PK822_08850, partial [Bacillota bacterium]|nr:hypothetical protein [Bacillota bacterium]